MERGSAPGPESPEWEALRTKAVELRRDGRTRREIGEVLGIANTDTLSDLLRGEPRVLGGKWPDTVKRERARTLRRFGYSQYEICSVLETSRSSVSRWVRDMPWDTGVSETSAYDPVEWEELRERARALRADGWSLPSIAEHLQLSVREDVERLCRGVRVGAGRGYRKPELRQQARDMRARGCTLPQIEKALGISRSTASLWVRDLPRPVQTRSPEQDVERLRRNRAAMEAQVYGPRRLRREQQRQAVKAAAAQDVGILSARERFLVGVALYWAEGAKDKWYSRRECFKFVNSDPDVIRLMVDWLCRVGVDVADITYRVSIHADADVARAEEHWAALVGVGRDELARTSLKRINTTTKRLNRGSTYYGCLVIQVRKSAGLYQRIDGAWTGIVEALPSTTP